MARPTLSSHPKFAKLAHRLASRSLARGVLELLWESCYASGEATIGDAEAVEAIADWRGEPGELAAILYDDGRGFLDALQTDANVRRLQYAVHDLEDHAPDYVLKRWERERKRQEQGQTIRSIRQAAARSKWMQTDASERRLQNDGRDLQANVLPPAPAPAPAPAPERDQSAPLSLPVNIRPPRAIVPVGLVSSSFLAVYDAYPNKNGKLAAAKVFYDLTVEQGGGPEAAERLSSAILAAFRNGLLKRHPYDGDPRFCWTLEKFLSERRWEDDASAPAPPRSPPESFAERDARLKREQRERDRADSRRQQAATDAKAAEYREWAEAK